jgi:uncharacterized protein (TIGR03663 family)
MKFQSALAMLLVIAGALALRVPHLDQRPLHNDEAVNAVKVTDLWQEGRYVYDPDEYHGPTLHYATLPFLWLSGAGNPGELPDATLRIAPVLFGVGLILLLPFFSDGLGRHSVAWAALLTAVSPAMVFYSRYFIHEMLLVFFTLLTLASGWRWTRTRLTRWAALTGVGLGLMFATKETFVLTVAAMVLACALTALWNHRKLRMPTRREWQHLSVALGATGVIWFVFFSSFFTNFDGLADSARTYLPWLKRAGGASPHIHEWSFYLQRLAWFHPVKGPVWSEALILVLAAIGIVVSFAGRSSPLHRFLALYTILLTVIYSVISYKTPWCLLSFFHGMILLAGIGAAAIVEFFRARTARAIVLTLLLGMTIQLTWQSRSASFEYASDRRNPYVYAQTVPDILNLIQTAEGVARVAPDRFATVFKVVAPDSDYWPLPWYLRRFQNVGWYETLPNDPFSPLVAVSTKLEARLDDRSERKWLMVGISELRPGTFFELYVELELWKKYVETLPPINDDD